MSGIQRSIILTILSLLMIGASGFSWAQTDLSSSDEMGTLRNEIEDLKEGQQAIRSDLNAIKELLTARQKPRRNAEDVNLSLNVAKDPTKGAAGAPLTLIEFTDYQCPFCDRHVRLVLPQLAKDFIDTGKIRYVLRDFPLTSIHKDAAKAHEAAHCAGEQGKYWEMHDQLFANQKALQSDKLAGYATEGGVTQTSEFQTCVDTGKYEEQIKASVAEGMKAGVRGTPSFLLGPTEANGRVKAGKLIRGAQPYSVFQQQINALLALTEPEGDNTKGTMK